MISKKNKTKRDILKNIYYNNTLTCSELSVLINKSFPLTTKLIEELTTTGLIKDNGLATSTGGRRGITYILQPDNMFMLSIAMDQYITRTAILDIENQPVNGIKSYEFPLKKNDYSAVNKLAEIINKTIANSNIEKTKILGAGISMPGFIDTINGTNLSFLPMIGKKSLVTFLQEKTGLEIFIDNDSSVIALAEQQFGKAKNKKDSLVINIGWGVGLGMILENKIFRGHNGFAGEFSHMSIFDNEKMCSCGKIGCVETESSLTGVIHDIVQYATKNKSFSNSSISLKHLEESFLAINKFVEMGNRKIINLIKQRAFLLGKGISILIHILNPDNIILSGRGAETGHIWKTPIQQAINEYCIHLIADSTTLEISDLKYNAQLIGTACLVMEQSN